MGRGNRCRLCRGKTAVRAIPLLRPCQGRKFRCQKRVR